MSDRALRGLVGLLVVVAALWGVATLLSGGSGDSAPTASGSLADFFTGVGTATTVRMEGPAGLIEIAPVGSGWTVNGLSADSGTVAGFYQTVAYAEFGELVASNPNNHARMGVSVDSAWTITIDPGGEARTLLVGDQGSRFATSFVRLPDTDDVYLLSGDIRQHIRRPLDQWRNRRVVAVDTAAVARVAVRRDGASYAVVRADSTWALEGGGAAAAMPVRNLLSELADLQAGGFLDGTEPLASEQQAISVTAFSADGQSLATLTIGGGSADRWLRSEGNDLLYRLTAFRVDRLAPPRSTLTGE